MDTSALVTLAGLVAFASAIGLIWRARRGSVHAEVGVALVDPSRLAPGAWLTLLQVSSPVCSYCQAMRGALTRVAGEHEGVEHLDFDVSEIPEIIDAFGIRQTPTTLLVDATGRVTHRINGPAQPTAIAALIGQAREDYLRRTDGYAI